MGAMCFSYTFEKRGSVPEYEELISHVEELARLPVKSDVVHYKDGHISIGLESENSISCSVEIYPEKLLVEVWQFGLTPFNWRTLFTLVNRILRKEYDGEILRSAGEESRFKNWLAKFKK